MPDPTTGRMNLGTDVTEDARYALDTARATAIVLGDIRMELNIGRPIEPKKLAEPVPAPPPLFAATLTDDLKNLRRVIEDISGTVCEINNELKIAPR